MSRYTTLIAIVLLFLLLRCSNNKAGTAENAADSTAVLHTTSSDTVNQLPDTSQPDSPAASLKTQTITNELMQPEEDTVPPKGPLNAALKRYLDWLKTKWKNVPNPFIASYQGNDFGDYQHIIFKDAKGETYDFGQAKNKYGRYQLHNLSGQYEDNPAYLGREFTIHWEWKITDFLCCEGDYEKVKARVPTIIKLELNK